MAIIHKVNFKIIKNEIVLSPKYSSMLKEKKITNNQLQEIIDKYNNVVKQTNYTLKVIK